MRNRKPKYFIQLSGLKSDSVFDVRIDSKYSLSQIHPHNTIYIYPLFNNKQPNFNDVVFYANLFSFLHDLPVYVSTTDERRKIAPVKPVFASNNSEFPDYYNYYRSYDIALEQIIDIRFGMGRVFFKWDDYFRKGIIDIITNVSRHVSKEISLYAMALNQLDPLSEYLNYYRVIESISNNNGKEWIKNNIDKINTYQFGKLFIYDIINRKTKNLWAIYKRRAINRLRQLKKKMNNEEIAKQLYNVNRCGIAHGKNDIITYSNSFNLIEISMDMQVLKLLARIAIEEKKLHCITPA